ncbi:conserved hypothetical protein, partial [Ricinus communis]
MCTIGEKRRRKRPVRVRSVTDGELVFLIEWGERMRRQGDKNVGPLLDSRDVEALRYYVLAFLVATERRVGLGTAGFPIEHPDGRGVE